MLGQSRLGGIILLALIGVAGCNAIFGISGGQPPPGAGGTGGLLATSTSTGLAGGGTTSTSTGTTSAELVITPSATSTLALASVQLAATSAGKPAAVTWSVVEAGGGTVEAGLYTAPFATGQFHVKATLGAQQAEAVVTVAQGVAPAVIVGTNVLSTATGHGSQSHLAYAQGAKQWWLFHDPSGVSALETMVSADFVTWQQGASASLPNGHSGDGRDLSVAYAQIAGKDVVHVTQGWGNENDTLGRYHLRGSASGGALAFGLVGNIGPGSNNPPDGSATVIVPGGQVIDCTGYVGSNSLDPPGSLMCGVGDIVAYTSDTADDGSGSFDSAAFFPQVLWCVPGTSGARQLLTVGDAVILLYDGGGTVAYGAGNVGMSVRSGGTWAPAEPDAGTPITPPPVFPTNQSVGLDDWTAAVASGVVHAVRRVGDSFDHQVLGADFRWTAGPMIGSVTTVQDSGLFLAPYGAGMILVALTTDGIVYTVLQGTTWSMWANLDVPAASRNYLSGFAPEGSPSPALIWTEAAGSSFTITGAALP